MLISDAFIENPCLNFDILSNGQIVIFVYLRRPTCVPCSFENPLCNKKHNVTKCK